MFQTHLRNFLARLSKDFNWLCSIDWKNNNKETKTTEASDVKRQEGAGVINGATVRSGPVGEFHIVPWVTYKIIIVSWEGLIPVARQKKKKPTTHPREVIKKCRGKLHEAALAIPNVLVSAVGHKLDPTAIPRRSCAGTHHRVLHMDSAQ